MLSQINTKTMEYVEEEVVSVCVCIYVGAHVCMCIICIVASDRKGAVVLSLSPLHHMHATLIVMRVFSSFLFHADFSLLHG